MTNTYIIVSLIKVMVMMTGELEYNDLYYPQREYVTLNVAQAQNSSSFNATINDRDIPQFFPFTAHLVLTVFILAVAIVIMNLLFGMAVSDVQVRSTFN